MIEEQLQFLLLTMSPGEVALKALPYEIGYVCWAALDEHDMTEAALTNALPALLRLPVGRTYTKQRLIQMLDCHRVTVVAHLRDPNRPQYSILHRPLRRRREVHALLVALTDDPVSHALARNIACVLKKELSEVMVRNYTDYASPRVLIERWLNEPPSETRPSPSSSHTKGRPG